MYEQRISPLIVSPDETPSGWLGSKHQQTNNPLIEFIFYAPVKLKKSVYMKRI